MARRLTLTAYAKPSEKELLEGLAVKLNLSHSEVIVLALKELHLKHFESKQ